MHPANSVSEPLQLPNLTFKHWLAVNSIQPYFNDDVFKHILENLKMLSLPTSATSVPLVVKYIRNQNKQGYLDYVAKYFTRLSADDFQGLSMSQELQADREILLAAVKQNCAALKYASQELKGDREILLAAVKQEGMAIVFASQELKGDREIVLAAVKQDDVAFLYASHKLQADREFVLAAVKQNGSALQWASQELLNDPELQRLAGMQ